MKPTNEDDVDNEPAPVLEPCRPTEPLTTPALPGAHNAAAAYRAGCEDEYSNRMQSRYGGEW